MNLQLFNDNALPSGVFPVHNNEFYIGTKGRDSGEEDFLIVKDLETFSPAIDGNTEEWSPLDQAGWRRAAVTGKALSFDFSGKRHYGDPGNDYVAGLMLATGQDAESIFKWVLPSGATLTMNCVINLTTPAGGDSTGIDGLEFQLLSDGKPTFLPAVAGGGA